MSRVLNLNCIQPLLSPFDRPLSLPGSLAQLKWFGIGTQQRRNFLAICVELIVESAVALSNTND